MKKLAAIVAIAAAIAIAAVVSMPSGFSAPKVEVYSTFGEEADARIASAIAEQLTGDVEVRITRILYGSGALTENVSVRTGGFFTSRHVIVGIAANADEKRFTYEAANAALGLLMEMSR